MLRSAWLIGGLYGMDANGSVEESGCEEVRIAGAPIDLESPVVRRRELANNFRSLGIPAEGSVVFTTG